MIEMKEKRFKLFENIFYHKKREKKKRTPHELDQTQK